MNARIVLAVGALVLLGGCSKVLDLPDRQLDPTFGTTSPTDTGGSGGSGGSSGGSGGSGGSGEAGQGGTAGQSIAGQAGSAGNAGSAGSAGSAGAALPTCAEYCSLVDGTCLPDQDAAKNHAVYPSETLCLAACAALPPGSPDKPEENSVYCRYQQAKKAASTQDFVDYCPPAGPGGGRNGDETVCGSNCDGYCTLMLAACAETFPTMTACQDACAMIPDLGNYNKSIQEGNSIQCRLYHVTAALETGKAFYHCPHASGKSLCVEPMP
jgi:hypothetical protein